MNCRKEMEKNIGKLVYIRNHRKRWCRQELGKIVDVQNEDHYMVEIQGVWSWAKVSEVFAFIINIDIDLTDTAAYSLLVDDLTALIQAERKPPKYRLHCL